MRPGLGRGMRYGPVPEYPIWYMLAFQIKVPPIHNGN